MATKKERKISFCTLIKKEWTTHKIDSFDLVDKIIAYINTLSKKARMIPLKESKIMLLQTATIEKDPDGNIIISGFFKSATHTFRPNLLDTDTGNERKSPKLLKEGDIEKTHFAIKLYSGEVFILLENNGNGVSIIQVVNYFSFFTKAYLKSKGKPKNFSIDHTKIGRGNFLDALDELKRARIAEVFFNKSLLGSAGLNFSNRTASLKRNLVLTASAEPTESIKETAIDFFNHLSNSGDGISKIRVYGNDKLNNKVMLDTSFIEKVDFLNVSLNPLTGEVTTPEMITGLKAFLKGVK